MKQKEIQQERLQKVVCRTVLTVLISFLAISVGAQQPVKTNLLYQHLKKTSYQFGALAAMATDTLELPFFDDFAYQGPSPDIRLWADNHVYINNTFSEDQKTRGIATFDHLDALGVPYNFLSPFASSNADTLTSQYIDLLDRSNSTPYAISDSIYLSFFVQKGGLGDVPEIGDSLLLQFALNDSVWKTIWSIGGGNRTEFEQYFVPITDPIYLFKTFQFRFINYVQNTGNMNHFHLDYIQLNEGRFYNDSSISDVAFTKELGQLLIDYSIMPYAHYLTNPAAFLKAQRKVFLRNNSDAVVALVDFETTSINDQSTVMHNIPFGTLSTFNNAANGDTARDITNFNLGGLSGDKPFIKSTFNLLATAYDLTENNYASLNSNNTIERTQEFNQLYAYDDGTAEAGFALDYTGLPNGPGYAAMRFNMAKTDTLQGLDIHFNRALEEVGTRPITLMFWKEIANATGKTDQVLYEITTTPTYVNQKNGFVRYELDTLIILPAGEFFVGWQQNSKFIINVGWDENYRYRNTNASNPNIFYNLLGTWEPLPAIGFEGVLMMRPLIGKPILGSVGTPVTPELKLNIYPNPSDKVFRIESDKKVSYQIINMQGKTIANSKLDQKTHSVEIYTTGIYICLIKDNENNIVKSSKIIIK